MDNIYDISQSIVTDDWRKLYKQFELTKYSRVLFENLVVPQTVEKFPALYGTQRFITMFTTALHLSTYPYREPDKSNLYPSILFLKSRNLVLSVHIFLGLPRHLFPFGFRIKNLCATHPFSFYPPNNIWLAVQSVKLLTMQFSRPLLTSCLLGGDIFLIAPL